LAELINIDFTYLSKLELGKSNYSPSPWLIRELARNLGADENELTNLAGKVPRGLQKMMQGNPLLTELVRELSAKALPDEVYQQLLDIARKTGEK
jgi:transcriptional regulator with XRE-family HTH domain